jgi:hypothetical protein
MKTSLLHCGQNVHETSILQDRAKSLGLASTRVILVCDVVLGSSKLGSVRCCALQFKRLAKNNVLAISISKTNLVGSEEREDSSTKAFAIGLVL